MAAEEPEQEAAPGTRGARTRWDRQRTDAVDTAALPGLARLSSFVRSVRTPEFQGVTFHEILAKSALNRVPDDARMLPPPYLASGVKAVSFDRLRANHPELVREYAVRYAKGCETPRSCQDALRDRLFPVLTRHELPLPSAETDDKFALHGRRGRPEPPSQDRLF